jgi:hypothetical protein
MTIDPIAGWTLVKTIADATKNLYEVAKGLKDHETKQKVDEVLDRLRDLKQQASELEDENRKLREKLRFKSDEFQFMNPFWFRKGDAAQAFCPPCFAKDIAAPMSMPFTTNGTQYRRCLVCGGVISERRR